MWMPVIIFQNSPLVYFPGVPDNFYPLEGKQNEKQNVIHAGKIHLHHFVPFARGAKWFSQWLYVAFSSNFCGSINKDVKISIMILHLSTLPWICWKSAQMLKRCHIQVRCSSCLLWNVKIVCWSCQPPRFSGPGLYSKRMKASCPASLTCMWSKLNIMGVILKIMLGLMNVFSHFQEGNESERARWIVTFPFFSPPSCCNYNKVHFTWLFNSVPLFWSLSLKYK